jgi:hypothetical protein
MTNLGLADSRVSDEDQLSSLYGDSAFDHSLLHCREACCGGAGTLSVIPTVRRHEQFRMVRKSVFFQCCYQLP